MISIEEKHYETVAEKLLQSMESCSEFFNGGVECDFEAFYATLKCTLIVSRREDADNDIIKITPVWWECVTAQDGVVCNNDFSWREFKEFIPC